MNDEVLWGRNILNAIRHVSDEGYQRRAWLGVGPEVSSPSEIYNVLFDDYGFSGFVEKSPAYVSATTKSILSLLENRMDEIDDAALADSQPEAFIDHPAWREVRHVAIEAVRCLEKDLDRAGN